MKLHACPTCRIARPVGTDPAGALCPDCDTPMTLFESQSYGPPKTHTVLSLDWLITRVEEMYAEASAHQRNDSAETLLEVLDVVTGWGRL